MPAKYKGEAVQCIKQAKEDDDLFSSSSVQTMEDHQQQQLQ